MRLIGSRTEQQMRDRLMRSHATIVSEKRYNTTLSLISSIGVDVDTLYGIYWIPEQTEDIHHFVHSGDDVIIVEIPYHGEGTIIERVPLSDYIKSLPRNTRMAIAIAKDIISKGGDAKRIAR